MTAQIVIMNKTAIALAADSAVTVEDRKVYNTINKLFALSKYEPVGIMVYNNAEFMGVPWESIIKSYRQKLGRQKFSTLFEYADDFVKYLISNKRLFPESEQRNLFANRLDAYFDTIRKEIDNKVKDILDIDKKITKKKIKEITKEIIYDKHNDFSKRKTLTHISKRNENVTRNKYENIISERIKNIFENLPLTINLVAQLKDIAIHLYTKDFFSQNRFSGLVIAGFGNKERFPSFKSYVIESLFNNVLKYKEDKNGSISLGNSAWMIPFAQQEMVVTFMEGIDPDFDATLDGYMSELCDRYPEHIVDNLKDISDIKRQKLKKKLSIVSKKILDDLKKKRERYKRKFHIGPIIRAVSFLPKDELAAMAESLVNLTSFKRRVTLDVETVGGPIDVAVISKGDGFVWIRRKHYFDAVLNPQFFVNYNLSDKR